MLGAFGVGVGFRFACVCGGDRRVFEGLNVRVIVAAFVYTDSEGWVNMIWS